MQAPHRSPEEIRAALEKALESPPELKEQPSFFAQAWERFVRWLEELGLMPSSLAGASDVLGVVMYVLLGVLVVLLLWYGWRIARQYAHARELALAAAAEEARESVSARVQRFLAEARAAQAAGDHRLALRLYFWALVVGLSGQGRIEYRDAWTGREMLERTRIASDLARQLGPIVREVDQLSFGGGSVLPGDSARMAQLCTEWLESKGGAARAAGVGA